MSPSVLVRVYPTLPLCIDYINKRSPSFNMFFAAFMSLL